MSAARIERYFISPNFYMHYTYKKPQSWWVGKATLAYYRAQKPLCPTKISKALQHELSPQTIKVSIKRLLNYLGPSSSLTILKKIFRKKKQYERLVCSRHRELVRFHCLADKAEENQRRSEHTTYQKATLTYNTQHWQVRDRIDLADVMKGQLNTLKVGIKDCMWGKKI